MKITNTKYIMIENEQGIHEAEDITISWRNVFIYVAIIMLIFAYVVKWGF